MSEMHERLQGKLTDTRLKAWSVGNLGIAYNSKGQIQKALECYEQALELEREVSNRQGEGVQLGNIAGCYIELTITSRGSSSPARSKTFIVKPLT
jgi:tetratricopeptide (TPR) repeat protein